MAIEKTIEGSDGRLAEGAYWVPVQINIGVADENGLIVFYGYASPQARHEKKAPIPGAIKEYKFNTQEFYAAQALTMDQLLGPGVAGDGITLYQVLGSFAYGIAKSRKDIPVLDEEGNPVLDESDNPVMRSFFEDGVDLI